MAIVEADISISMDGFVTGPDTGQYPGLGQGGEILHAWLGEPDGEKIIGDTFASSGAVLTSRAIYDGTGGWGQEPPFRMPVFVVTHRPHEAETRGQTTFTFVSDGITRAIEQAAATAGDKKVHVMGGASIIQQALNAGLVDQLHLHVAPVLLGDGTPLFAHLDGPIRLEQIEAVTTRFAHHLRYRVEK
jgi:dihydrofolate reductase